MVSNVQLKSYEAYQACPSITAYLIFSMHGQYCWVGWGIAAAIFMYHDWHPLFKTISWTWSSEQRLPNGAHSIQLTTFINGGILKLIIWLAAINYYYYCSEYRDSKKKSIRYNKKKVNITFLQRITMFQNHNWSILQLQNTG